LIKQPLLQKQNKPQQTVGLASWMGRAAEECERAGSDLASGPVHDLRVALRRCRSLADGLMAVDPEPEWKAMKKAGKALFSSLGELRDTQVMTEWVQKLGPPQDPETQALLDLLSKDEQNHKLKAAEALRAFDLRQWRKWSVKLPRRAGRLKPGSNIFRHLALERWTEAHDLHRRALRNRSQAAFHQLRIGIKRFRYIVENFLPVQHQLWNADLKELQDLLGDVHDLDVLWSTATRVNAFSSPESRTRWHAIVHEPREKRIARYREKMTGPQSLWNTWRAELPQGSQVQVGARARLTLWASFLDPDFAHSQRVAALAVQVFDGLFALGLAPSSPNQDLRSILQTAAFVHDVGRSKKEKGHHKSSYRLVRRHLPPLGYTASDLQLAAAVARFHRGALPQSRHKAVRELAADQKTIVLGLAGILRFADALDKDSQGRIRRLRIFEKDRAVIVQAQGYAAWTRAAENIAASRHLLETVLRRPFLVKAMPAPGVGRQSRTAPRTVR
jgi:CHAD domain-containing protein